MLIRNISYRVDIAYSILVNKTYNLLPNIFSKYNQVNYIKQKIKKKINILINELKDNIIGLNINNYTIDDIALIINYNYFDIYLGIEQLIESENNIKNIFIVIKIKGNNEYTDYINKLNKNNQLIIFINTVLINYLTKYNDNKLNNILYYYINYLIYCYSIYFKLNNIANNKDNAIIDIKKDFDNNTITDLNNKKIILYVKYNDKLLTDYFKIVYELNFDVDINYLIENYYLYSKLELYYFTNEPLVTDYISKLNTNNNDINIINKNNIFLSNKLTIKTLYLSDYNIFLSFLYKKLQLRYLQLIQNKLSNNKFIIYKLSNSNISYFNNISLNNKLNYLKNNNFTKYILSYNSQNNIYYIIYLALEYNNEVLNLKLNYKLILNKNISKINKSKLKIKLKALIINLINNSNIDTLKEFETFFLLIKN